MRFSSLAKLVSYLIAALGLLALSFGGELSLVSLGMLALGYVASYFVEGPFVRTKGWSRVVTSALCVLLAVQLLRGLSGQAPWLGLAMELSGWLSISRLCNRRTAADHQQIAMLAFIQLIAATVLTTALSYAALFLAFVIVTPWALTLSHLQAEIERNYPAEGAGSGTDLSRVLASRRIVGPRFLLWTALLSVPVLLMTLGLFVVFPRVGLGFIGRNTQRGTSVAGFGDNVQLGGFGLIQDDATVVLRVSAGRELTPEERTQYLRLRGTSFDHYDGRTWTRATSEPVRMAPMKDYYALRRVQSDDDLVLKLVLERIDQTVLFLPAGTVGIRIPQRGIPGVPRNQVGVLRSHGLDLRYQSAEELGLVYDAIVSVDPEESDVPVARDTDDARYLQLPEGHEQVSALAHELAEGITDPERIARRFENYLRDGDRFKYSLQQPDTAGKQPLDVFLFEAKRGHCEYFASSLAIMLRAVGIPARNVTGFAGGEYNPYGGYYAVRQSDAHSWVEALLPGRGWVTFDPTPPSFQRGRASLFAHMRAALDAARNYWMTRVVGYDLRSQIRALRTLSTALRQLSLPGFKLGGGGDNPRDAGTTGQLGTGALLLLGGLFSVLLGVGVVLAWRNRKRRAVRRLPDSALRARELYLELERTLQKQGKQRPKHVTAEQHASALTQQGFPAASAVRELTQEYVAARYGQYELSQARLKVLRRLLDEVKRAA